MGRLTIRYFLLFVFLLVTISCGGSSGGSGDEGNGGNLSDPEAEVTFQYNNVPQHPLIAVYTVIDTKEIIHLYGQKDKNGDPIKVDAIEYREAGQTLGDEPITVLLNDEDKPYYITLPDGSVTLIEYEQNIGTVTIKDPNGNVGVMKLDFDETNISSAGSDLSNMIYQDSQRMEAGNNSVTRGGVTTETYIKVRANIILNLVDEDSGEIIISDMKTPVVKVDVSHQYEEKQSIATPFKDSPGYKIDIYHGFDGYQITQQTATNGNVLMAAITGAIGTSLGAGGYALKAAGVATGPLTPWGAVALVSGVALTSIGNTVIGVATVTYLHAGAQGAGERTIFFDIIDKPLGIFSRYQIDYDTDDFEKNATTDVQLTIDIPFVGGIFEIGTTPKIPEACQDYQIYFDIYPPSATVHYEMKGQDGYFEREDIPGNGTRIYSEKIFAAGQGIVDQVEAILKLNDVEVGKEQKFDFFVDPGTLQQPDPYNTRPSCSGGEVDVSSVYIIARNIDTTYEAPLSNPPIRAVDHTASFPIENNATVSYSGNKLTENHDVIGNDNNHYQGNKQLTIDEDFQILQGFNAYAKITFDEERYTEWSLSGSKSIALSSSGPTYKEFKIEGSETCQYIDSVTYFQDYGSWDEVLVSPFTCDQDSSLLIRLNMQQN